MTRAPPDARDLRGGGPTGAEAAATTAPPTADAWARASADTPKPFVVEGAFHFVIREDSGLVRFAGEVRTPRSAAP